ncbi:hypothetical protein HU200_044077 [Digitaria exilis]|uniref:DUF4220 domain-containing protein n=1 Tax=Digitaria exilis TaxID=1010633 RepID=A0A835B333_9POAL|nr:hypothetical protein HU200_044077 [Digitaria exilis]
MECAEATRPETRKFVLEGLLSEKESIDNYARAFHIIEAELGFLYDFFFTNLYIFGSVFYNLMILFGKTSTEVPDLVLVKREIVSCLLKYNEGDPLTNGRSALNRHGVLGKFSWTLEDHSQTGIMLVWHIATEYCSMPFSSEQEGGGANMPVWHQIYCCLRTKKIVVPCNQEIATTLSRYCTYLMSSVPDLLPGNSADTSFTLERVLWEAKLKLGKRKPCKKTYLETIQDSKSSSNEDIKTTHDSRCNNEDITTVHDNNDNTTDGMTICDSSPNTTKDEITIVQDSSDNNADNTVLHNSSANNAKDSIFIQGLKLGRQLDEMEDEARWSLLAEFWAETIIYISPSDNAKVHMERISGLSSPTQASWTVTGSKSLEISCNAIVLGFCIHSLSLCCDLFAQTCILVRV